MKVGHPAAGALLGLALVAAPACSAISSGIGSLTGKTQKQEAAARLATVQTGVMAFADAYVGGVLEATARIPTSTPEDQVRLLAFQVRQASAAFEIASGENPVANVVDMVILVTASRRIVDTYWLPNVFGEAGKPLASTLAQLEPAIWKVSAQILTAEQQEVLRAFIDDWLARNPQSRDSSSIRIAQLSTMQGASAAGLGTPVDLLKSVGLDIFGAPALAEVQRSRVLAERAFYFTKRWPQLLEMQSRLLTLQLAQQPASAQLLGDLSRVSAAADSVARTTEQLPGLVDRQREAAIRQVLEGMQAQEAQARAVLADLHATLDAATRTVEAVHGVVGAVQPILATVSNRPEPDPGAPPSRPFDITEYTQALQELGALATKLEGLLLTVNQEAPRVAALLGDASREAAGHGHALVEFAFWRALALVLSTVGAALVAALVYRWASIRMARSHVPAGL